MFIGGGFWEEGRCCTSSWAANAITQGPLPLIFEKASSSVVEPFASSSLKDLSFMLVLGYGLRG